MTGDRMTAERESELRAAHTPSPLVWRCGCGRPYPCETREALDALAAERAHAQQVEVPHSSAAVLGYVVAEPNLRGGWTVLGNPDGSPHTGTAPTPAELRRKVYPHPNPNTYAALIRVGADGRIAP